jgi:1-acyl-sn-glycerol-3-phosphate acyltransferase
MIYINRSNGKESLRQIKSQLLRAKQEHGPVIIFPQGTRSSPDNFVRFKSGIYQIAKDSNLSILPVAHNSGYCWPKGSYLKYSGKIDVRILGMIDISNDDRGIFIPKLEKLVKSHIKTKKST